MRIAGLLLFFVLISANRFAANPDASKEISEFNKGLLHLLDRAESGGAALDQAIEIIQKRSDRLFDRIQKNRLRIPALILAIT